MEPFPITVLTPQRNIAAVRSDRIRHRVKVPVFDLENSDAAHRMKKDEVRTQAIGVRLDIDLSTFGDELVKEVEHSVFAKGVFTQSGARLGWALTLPQRFTLTSPRGQGEPIRISPGCL
jgi:hypothetical protein